MPYQPKDWKMNDLIKEEDLDHIEQGLLETSILAEMNASLIFNIENVLSMEEDSLLKNYIDNKNAETTGAIPLVDSTLTQPGQSADASIVGEKIEEVIEELDTIKDFIGLGSESEFGLNDRLSSLENNEAIINIQEAQKIKADAAASATRAENAADRAEFSASQAANNSIDEIRQYLYWKAGDIYEKKVSEKDDVTMFWCCPGYLSNSSKSIHFSINVGKPIIAKKVSISNLNIFVRSVEGYIWGNWDKGFIPVGSALTASIPSPQTGTISIRIDYSNGWNIAGSSKLSPNNRPCSVTIGTIKIEFTD